AKGRMKRAESGDVRLRLVAAQAAALFADESLLKQFDTLGARARKAPPAQCIRELEALQLGEAKEKACELVAAQFEGLAIAVEAAHACRDSAPWRISLCGSWRGDRRGFNSLKQTRSCGGCRHGWPIFERLRLYGSPLAKWTGLTASSPTPAAGRNW